jgi:hypothetical protein
MSVERIGSVASLRFQQIGSALKQGKRMTENLSGQMAFEILLEKFAEQQGDASSALTDNRALREKMADLLNEIDELKSKILDLLKIGQRDKLAIADLWNVTDSVQKAISDAAGNAVGGYADRLRKALDASKNAAGVLPF